jgi:hypothetical protein
VFRPIPAASQRRPLSATLGVAYKRIARLRDARSCTESPARMQASLQTYFLVLTSSAACNVSKSGPLLIERLSSAFKSQSPPNAS